MIKSKLNEEGKYVDAVLLTSIINSCLIALRNIENCEQIAETIANNILARFDLEPKSCEKEKL